MKIQKEGTVLDTREHNIIIPEKYSFYNTKRIEQTSVVTDPTNPNSRRVTTLEVREEAYVDMKRMRKTKEDFMLNLLMNRMPKGVRLDITSAALATGNKKNIVFDTTKEQKPYTSIYAESENCSERMVQAAIKECINEGWLLKLNKYQYMLNPYFIVHPSISTSRIAELQHYWDRITNGEAIKTPIEWRKTEKLGDSFETKRDLKALYNNVVEADIEAVKLKDLRKQHLNEDVANVENNMEDWGKVLVEFMVKHKYSIEDMEKSASLQHLKRYIIKGQKEEWLDIDADHLHLEGIKPLRVLLNLCKEEND